PAAERNEVYVLVAPDDVSALTASAKDEAGTANCRVGDWVRVSFDSAWSRTVRDAVEKAKSTSQHVIAWLGEMSVTLAEMGVALAKSDLANAARERISRLY